MAEWVLRKIWMGAVIGIIGVGYSCQTEWEKEPVQETGIKSLFC